MPDAETDVLESPEISVVVPVYNSSKTLPDLYERLRPVLSALSLSWEIILVDDASKDNSFHIMETLRDADPRVQIIRFGRNQGQHSAIMCGLKYSRGQYVFTLDDDLQHPPEEFPKLMDALRNGYQVVIGRYDVKRHTTFRNLGSLMVNRLIAILTGKPPDLALTNLKLFSRDAVDAITAFRGRDFYLGMVMFDAVPASSMCNVDVRHSAREHGVSGYTLRKSLKLVSTILIYHTRFSFFLLLAGILSAGIALVLLLLLQQSTLLVSLIFFPGVAAIMLGISGVHMKRVSQGRENATPFLSNSFVDS